MEFGEFMINLCIGIVSGAFSSIIISRVFFILSTHNEQVSRIQGHIENTYTLNGILWGSLLLSDNIARDVDIFLIEEMNKSIAKQIREKAKQECERFDSMIFDDLDGDLHIIAVDLNDYMNHLSFLTQVNKKGIKEIEEKLQGIQTRFTIYKNNRKGHFAKAILKDKWLWWTAGIFLVVVVVTIFTNVDICSLFVD